MNNEKTDWHLDKKVSLSIICLLIINIATTAWYLSAAYADIQSLKAKPDLLPRVIKLESRVDEYGRILSRIDTTLDRINTTLYEVSKEQAKRVGAERGKTND